MSAITNQSGLVSDRFKIDFLPGPAHVGELFLVGEDGIQCLGDLIDIQEPYYMDAINKTVPEHMNT